MPAFKINDRVWVTGRWSRSYLEGEGRIININKTADGKIIYLIENSTFGESNYWFQAHEISLVIDINIDPESVWKGLINA